MIKYIIYIIRATENVIQTEWTDAPKKKNQKKKKTHKICQSI